jgi:sugar phosphate isomerase/epimerase
MAIKRPIIALQLYTLRDVIDNDTVGVLRQLKEMGYEGVELAGYGSLSRGEFKNACDEIGLVVTSTHIGIAQLETNFSGVVEDAQVFGYSLVGVPFLDESRRGSKENWLATAKKFNELGKKLRDDAGLTFFYHNHAFEFEEKFDGQYGLDILFENSDPQFLQAELDTYWVQKGGESPTAYLQKYAGRTPLLHIKDMGADGDFAEIGTGSLDWPSIFSAAEAGGVTAYIVEQDTTPGNPLDSVRISVENLKKMGKLD